MAHPPVLGLRTASTYVRLAFLCVLLAAAAFVPAAAEAVPAAWSKARGLCEAGKVEEGWRALVQAEKAAGKKPLPAEYWRDVLACASRATLPANAARAGKMLDAQKQATPEDRALVAKARASVRVPEGDVVIPPEQAWIVHPKKDGFLLVNTPCGFAFTPRQDRPLLPPVQQRGCSVRTWAPPYKGKTGEQRPSIVVIARAALPDEKLEDYAKLILPAPTWKPAKLDGVRCPAARCVVHGARIPGLYGPDGDSVRFAVAFERTEPEFPGLALEDPGPRETIPGSRTAGPAFGRFRGTIHYIVMFDSAASIAEKAKGDYRRFLADLKVE